MHSFRPVLLITATLLALAQPAAATWSIVIVDRDTGEVAIGSATCLLNFDLERFLPVVRPEKGAAAAQSYVDFSAQNRIRLWNGIGAGTHPDDILAELEANDSEHQTRQYGIVDTRGRAATFSGTQNGAYANGLTGQVGSLVYAIQGNVITGQPVLDMAELAILNTPGGIPEKLMAAMEAARAMGGDGRCSCRTGPPDSCGSPPPDFIKSAHIGFMIVTRRGDFEGGCGNPGGCAAGTYYMDFNILANSTSQPDPVIQLREQFDQWRLELIGVPDAIESDLTVDPPVVLNDGQRTATVRIQLRDWQGAETDAALTVYAYHNVPGSAGSSQIAPAVHLGNGLWEIQLTPTAVTGLDRLAVALSTPSGAIFLMPDARLYIQDARGDLNEDGVVNTADLEVLMNNYGAPGGDVDGDGDTDFADVVLLLSFLIPGL